MDEEIRKLKCKCCKWYDNFDGCEGIGCEDSFEISLLKLKEVAKHVPSNAYVLETDAPYLTPTPHRGEVNHSKYLNFIAQEIANLKGIDVSDVINETTSNFKRLFSL